MSESHLRLLIFPHPPRYRYASHQARRQTIAAGGRSAREQREGAGRRQTADGDDARLAATDHPAHHRARRVPRGDAADRPGARCVFLLSSSLAPTLDRATPAATAARGSDGRRGGRRGRPPPGRAAAERRRGTRGAGRSPPRAPARADDRADVPLGKRRRGRVFRREEGGALLATVPGQRWRTAVVADGRRPSAMAGTCCDRRWLWWAAAISSMSSAASGRCGRRRLDNGDLAASFFENTTVASAGRCGLHGGGAGGLFFPPNG